MDIFKFFAKLNQSHKAELFSLDVLISNSVNEFVQNFIILEQNCKRLGNMIVKRAKKENVEGVLWNLRYAKIGKIEPVNVSIEELIEQVPQISGGKEKFSIEDFLKQSENQGRQFFEELDRDKDGKVSLEDLEFATSKRKIPRRHAREILHCTRNLMLSNSIDWKQFSSLMQHKELDILKAYTNLSLSESTTFKKSKILASFRTAGVSENEGNTLALMHYLNSENGGSFSYNEFRNFMLLLHLKHLKGHQRNRSHERVSVSQSKETLAQDVLKSALAGGIACSFSAFVMHPVDTIKTCVQASTLSLPELVSKIPEFGLQGMYKGSIPAVLGQFTSHGLRTGFHQASKFILSNAAPGLPEVQVESLVSFCSTVLGTTYRVPFEVLKQRLQAGIFDNVGEAAILTWQQDGMRGFFRGTGATLCRELPFYVFGAGLYGETKKAMQKVLKRNLEPWETVVVGAITGGFASVLTTPFDVMKTRMMTTPQGLQVSMQMAALTIVHEEGAFALFRGAVPRFFWVAPLGAMNFAGYELIRKAMDRI